ncbi:hypothetical protein V6N13_137400 [Hibiscus sabdariffa]|uniref:E3 ubiquitin-protein ligase n=1 Tax=Hibiscus sabdariffa TaxID=183260 RepID=A0ABR2DKR9_9ROSI
MESPAGSLPMKPRDRVVRRLSALGIPMEYLERSYEGIVDFVNGNGLLLPEIVSAILPAEEDVAESIQDISVRPKKWMCLTMKNQFRESMLWLQWLMFQDEPMNALKNLANSSVGQRGVCGAVWGSNDIAYRCRTCEHDPTCAICVPCFQNGNHKDHDYSTIYTGGGCCDCGDETAWKREGFCSKHKGSEQIQPLDDSIANSVGPVFDALFICWKNKLFAAEHVFRENMRATDRGAEQRKAANELTYVVVEMLIEFCKHSDSLLSFVARRVISLDGLLDILVRAEKFVGDGVAKKLHEVLLKLLADPVFKNDFSKAFLSYYPTVINEAIKEGSDSIFIKKYPLISTFSVQIFTVPTLTPRLVKEMNLLDMLLKCLGDIFLSCAREDGRLQAAKWGSLYDTTNRVIEDIRVVMSHDVVSRYAIHEQKDIIRTWLKLLTFVQGMNPIKRETGLHIEEENESMHLPFVLSYSISNIHSLLVHGAFAVASSEGENILSYAYRQDVYDVDSIRHAKVGRLSQESSVYSGSGRSVSKTTEIGSDSGSIPSSAIWLIQECLRAMETWLEVDGGTSAALQSLSSPNSSSISDGNFLAIKKTLYNIKKGKYFGKLTGSSENHSSQCSSPSGNQSSDDMGDVSPMETESGVGLATLRVLSLCEWPDIVYDVSSQEISVHIPLYRLFSLLLQKALVMSYGESVLPNIRNACSASTISAHADFFGHILRGCNPLGFSASVMEHPLRIRVFCAQVIAGMWRKNGDAAVVSCEWYRSVRWTEQGLELDLFLLQCCAALAPPDLCVKRIVERFGLLNYLSLTLERSNEYEPVLVQEMLTLIMQILLERRFCGRNTADSLERELVYKLAIGNATHSQLVKSLPRDLSKSDQLQEILDRVAVYSNPSGFNQGMYSLRWAYWKELDLYHPRWNSRDLQVAEERYLRFCGVPAMTTQLPKWTKIYPPLEGVAKIATCRETLKIIRAVLFYSVFTDKCTESRAPDGILVTALHLLALALDIYLQQNRSGGVERHIGDSNSILAFASEEITESLNYGAGKQSLLSLLVALMRMHRQDNVKSYMESSNCNFSPLIESSLKKFAEVDSQCMTKLQQLAPEVVSHLSESTSNTERSTPGSASDGEMRKAKARERQAAIMAKMKAEQSKFLSSITSTADDDSKSEEEISDSDTKHEADAAVQQSCSLCHDPTSKAPVSFLILLQKSRLLSFVDRGPPSWDQCSDKEQGYIPTNRLTNQNLGSNASASSSGLTFLPAQLTENSVAGSNNNGQEHDREVNAILEFFKSRFPSVRSIQAPFTPTDVRDSSTIYSLGKVEEDMYISIRNKMCDILLSSSFRTDEASSAVECSSENHRDVESDILGKYIVALSSETIENSLGTENTDVDRELMESTSQPLVYDGFGPLDCDGIYLSSCGHAVHQGCLDRYLSSLKERFARRSFFEGAHIVDPNQGEFLCPVCRRLANSVLPVVNGTFQKAGRQPTSSAVDQVPSFGSPSSVSKETCSLLLQQGLCLLKTAAKVVGRPHFFEAVSLQRKENLSQDLEPISRVLSRMYFSKKRDRFLGSPRLSLPIILWDTLKYSLMSTEIAARSGKTSAATNYTLASLYEEFKSSSEFIFSLLQRVVKNLSSTNSLHALQRYRGLQLFAVSICSGADLVNNRTTNKQEDILLHVLKQDDKETLYPDIQLWNRASDPVLARDPFSSLIWVLFCLPCPFFSCEESLLSLVHLFYAVSVIQALIICCRRHGCKINGLDTHLRLITDICGVLEDSDCAQWYAVSNDVDLSCDIKQMIRRLSFPYLRRCALLWKLLNNSAPAPFCDRDNVLESSHVTTDMMDTTESVLVELSEIQELEKMFKIPPIDVVLEDEVLQSFALKWFHHFKKVYETCSFQNVFYCNPTVPFKLMNLPHVYQDLLQRYIKQPCPDCKTILAEPALCLSCGRLCSPSWKSCCRESGCMVHAMNCGAGIGVFLLIRRTTILLQRCARQAPWPSPYLDAFGEEDIEMHRGKPLYLNEERYSALTYMVASHGLDRSSKVLGQTTIARHQIA